MKRNLLIIILILFYLSAPAQKAPDPSEKIVFVYCESRLTNYIVIPNIGKLYSFKIYRKTKADTGFIQVAETKSHRYRCDIMLLHML